MCRIKKGMAVNMNNEVVKEIRKEDKKKLKGYLILCIIGLLGGGVGGYASAWFKDNGNGIQSIGDAVRNLITNSSYYVNLTVAIISVILVVILLKQCRSMYQRWDNEDEDSIYKIEYKLGIALTITAIDTVIMMVSMVIGFGQILSYDKLSEISVIKICCFVLGNVMMALFTVIAQQKIVNFEKEINPEKQGSVYDIKFRKKWVESCDEAERLKIYQSAYSSYIVTSGTCMALIMFSLCAMYLWDTGIMPVIVVGIIWMVQMVSYCVKSIQLDRREIRK